MAKPPYNFMHELGFGATTVVSIDDSQGSVDVSFTINEEVPLGTPVKVTGDNTVGKVTAATDMPIGIVLNTETKSDRIIAVVKTQFMAIKRAEATGGAVVAGDKLNAVELNATSELFKYNTAGTNKSAVALVGGADTEEIIVGVLKSSYAV